jgi:hypothetical protein
MDFPDLPPRPKTVRCLKCKRSIKVKPVGRLPTFCSPSCRQMVFRKLSRMPKPPAPTRDELAVRIWEMLTEFGLVTGDLPPPKRKPEENHHGPQDAHRDHRQAAAL